MSRGAWVPLLGIAMSSCAHPGRRTTLNIHKGSAHDTWIPCERQQERLRPCFLPQETRYTGMNWDIEMGLETCSWKVQEAGPEKGIKRPPTSSQAKIHPRNSHLVHPLTTSH